MLGLKDTFTSLGLFYLLDGKFTERSGDLEEIDIITAYLNYRKFDIIKKNKETNGA